jgi:hypothetical protein
VLVNNTSDGLDNKTTLLCGGGSYESSRGATIALRGNENAAHGNIELMAGDGDGTTTGAVSISGNTFVNGDITATENINSASFGSEWESLDPTITGMTGFFDKRFYRKRDGKRRLVVFSLAGTSTGEYIEFEVADVIDNTVSFFRGCGSTGSPPVAVIVNAQSGTGVVRITVDKSGALWPGSGTITLSGQIEYYVE